METENNKYFVQVAYDNQSLGACVMTEHEIINRIDMRDCSNEELAIFRSVRFGEIERLIILGPWHNMGDPLLIEVIDKDGTVIFSGYGTDH